MDTNIAYGLMIATLGIFGTSDTRHRMTRKRGRRVPLCQRIAGLAPDRAEPLRLGHGDMDSIRSLGGRLLGRILGCSRLSSLGSNAIPPSWPMSALRHARDYRKG